MALAPIPIEIQQSDIDVTIELIGSSTDKHYEVAFTNQTSLVVTHNLGKKPAVTIVDASGNEVFADVQHTSINNFTLSFSPALTGMVLCN